MTDPIADMLTRLRNASLASKAEVLVPFSKVKFAIAKILEKEKYVTAASATDGKTEIKLILRYDDKKPAITMIKRASKVGCRLYAKKTELPRVLNGLGFAIISTSKGIMTNREARTLGLGGEVICEVY
jgi:small subunit ribosomal protein S8